MKAFAMDAVEKNNYRFHRHNLNVSSDESDVFKQAHLRRKLRAQNFFASLSLLNNASTCHLLEEDFKSYIAVVDSRSNGSVNNYADAAMALASHCKNETKEWKSHLKSSKQEVSNLLSEIKCHDCMDWKPSENFLKLLSQPHSSGTTENPQLTRKTTDKSMLQPSEQSKTTALKRDFQSSNSSFGRGISVPDMQGSNFKPAQFVDDFEFSFDLNTLNQNASVKTVQAQPPLRSDFRPKKVTNDTSAIGNKIFTERSTGNNIAAEPGSCWTVAKSTISKKDAINFGKELMGSGNSFVGENNHFDKVTRGGTFASNRGRGTSNSGPRKFAEEHQKNYQQSDAGMSSAAANFFKTARDELVEQSAKKNNNGRGGNANGYGRGSYCNNESNYNVDSGQSRGGNLQYGAQKRSLGTARRAGVFGKFVPPVKPSEDDQLNGRQGGRNDNKDINDGTEEDERLKGIDPKMIELIRNEIMEMSATVSWEDIAGLEFAKATIQEIVVWPMLRPDIFTGLRKPPKGLLLFGPPGTGKTLIGKCIASQSQSTFFSISASSLTSKWIGDGEKMVRALFAVARCHQPAVVFIDEIDSLLTQRSDTEHESSRRIKTEFLVQLDGAGTGDEERILVVGATNRPQELDEAARRRLVKRLYIPLPEFEARRQIVERLMSTEKSALSAEQISEIARLSNGYSGADMKNLCQEASLGPIRSLSFSDMHQITADEVRPVEFEDFRTALNRVRASVSQKDLDQYVAWDQTYGMCGGAF